jgi:hypothetical protein
MKLPRAAAAALFLILFSGSMSTLGALQVDSGQVRLVLHEGSGRYSLYVRSPEEPETYVPLFVDRDPRTSWLSVVVNGRIFRLGEGGEFRESAAALTPTGARFEWQSKTLRVSQDFYFLSPPGAAAVTGVQITVTLTNVGSSPLSVGLRDCLDTYLGESQQAHFDTQPGGAVTAETTFGSDRMIRYWLSAGKKPAGVGLQRIVSGPGITAPDRIVFANWKRLNEVSWAYDTSIGRSFNLLPYSINDSAVCQYYEPVSIPPGGSRRIVSVLGNYSPSGYVAAAPTPAAEAPADSVPAPPGQTPGLQPPSAQAGAGAVPGSPPTSGSSGLETQPAIRDAVRSLDALLQQIDRVLASGRPLTDEDVQLIQQALSAIKSRSEPYLQNR